MDTSSKASSHSESSTDNRWCSFLRKLSHQHLNDEERYRLKCCLQTYRKNHNLQDMAMDIRQILFPQHALEAQAFFCILGNMLPLTVHNEFQTLVMTEERPSLYGRPSRRVTKSDRLNAPKRQTGSCDLGPSHMKIKSDSDSNDVFSPQIEMPVRTLDRPVKSKKVVGIGHEAVSTLSLRRRSHSTTNRRSVHHVHHHHFHHHYHHPYSLEEEPNSLNASLTSITYPPVTSSIPVATEPPAKPQTSNFGQIYETDSRNGRRRDFLSIPSLNSLPEEPNSRSPSMDIKTKLNQISSESQDSQMEINKLPIILLRPSSLDVTSNTAENVVQNPREPMTSQDTQGKICVRYVQTLPINVASTTPRQCPCFTSVDESSWYCIATAPPPIYGDFSRKVNLSPLRPVSFVFTMPRPSMTRGLIVLGRPSVTDITEQPSEVLDAASLQFQFDALEELVGNLVSHSIQTDPLFYSQATQTNPIQRVEGSCQVIDIGAD